MKAPTAILRARANRILSRDEFAESRPLEKQLWAGAIDTVGDKVLAKVLAQMNYGGCVAACGWRAASRCRPPLCHSFCVMCVCKGGLGDDPTGTSRRSRARLVKDLPESFYAQAATEITLADAPKFADAIINNQVQGRTLVKIK